MIKKPIVFILGAGASMPFQFPSGSRLKQSILQNLRVKNGEFYKTINSFFDTEKIIDDFFSNLAKSGQLSVDAFLEHRREFLNVGKLAIALYLIKYEREGSIFKIDRKELSWYEYLFNKLDAPFEEFGNNKLSIITFNYDRSLEYFLFTALKNTSGRPDEKCAEELNKIPIIHVHGRLGMLPWQGKLSRPYRPECSLNELEMASKQIIVIREDVKTHKSFKQAFDLMSTSTRIFFLGFGYHDANLERLNIKEIKHISKEGTALGLGEAEADYIRLKWGINLPPSHYNVIDFLRNEVPWIEFL